LLAPKPRKCFDTDARTIMGREAIHLDVLDDPGPVTCSNSVRTVTVRLRPQPMREVMEWRRRCEHVWSGSLGRLAASAENKDTEARRRGR
jgi:hypothetical protein